MDADARATPQAFSHFTYECSQHRLLIVDIQGVGDLWTDPQIHTHIGTDYGNGNLGTRGMALFFYSHVCNRICKSLDLSPYDLSPQEQLQLKRTNSLSRRETLPTGYEEPLKLLMRKNSDISEIIEDTTYLPPHFNEGDDDVY